MAENDNTPDQSQQPQRRGPANGGNGGNQGGSNATQDDARRRGAGTGDNPNQAMQDALQRELQGTQVWDYTAPRDQRMVGPTGVPLIWVASNRADNRAVGFWKDEHQPGGEVFLGPGATKVARTADIEAYLSNGQIVEVPEPRYWARDPESGGDLVDERGRKVPNRKYPALPVADPTSAQAAQPGRPTPLGRNFDPDLWDEDALQQIRERQARLPRELAAPVGGIVPGVTHPIA